MRQVSIKMAQLQRYSLNDTKNPALTLERTRKFISPPWGGGGGWMKPLLEVCDMLQCFVTILPLMDSV